ncbi:hypothetical protein JCM8097_005601 [Rhodosporidiobolus ruineniae]
MASVTSLSASTALVSTGGGVNNPEEGVEEGKTSPFDRLPDEVILLILQAIYAGKRKSALLDLRVNKRIFTVAKAAWYATFKATPYPLLILAARRDLHPYVQHLAYSAGNAGEFVYAFEILTVCSVRNLTSLTLCGTVDDAFTSVDLPLPVTVGLSNLENLKSLSLVYEQAVTFADTEFSIGSDLPQLEELVLTSEACQRQLLSTPCPHLRSLKLGYGDKTHSDCDAVPWASLELFEIGLPAGSEASSALDNLANSLRTALFPNLNPRDALPLPDASTAVSFRLRALRLQPTEYSAQPYAPDPDVPLLQELKTLLEILSLTSIEHLCLHPHTLSAFPSDLPQIQSLTSLTLCHPALYLNAVEERLGFLNLLSLFPNLEVLHLEGTGFRSVSSQSLFDRFTLTGPAPDPLEALEGYHDLHAVVEHVKQSKVVAITWEPNELETFVWTRTRVQPSEEFEVERFTPYETEDTDYAEEDLAFFDPVDYSP